MMLLQHSMNIAYCCPVISCINMNKHSNLLLILYNFRSIFSSTLINGVPIVKLPPKRVFLKKVDFSQEERSFYSKLEADLRKQFKKLAAAGTVKKNYASILLMLLRLRQACNHPLLVKRCHSDAVGKDSLKMASQLPKDMLLNFLHQLEGSLAICRVCKDPPENAVVTMCGHVFCYQCVSERLNGDDNLCPASGCKETLGTELIFSQATLQSCLSDQHDNTASSSGLTPNEESSLFQSGYTSSKIKAALEILNSLCSPTYNLDSSYLSTNPEIPVKAIVFSQWNGMLDLVEDALNCALIQYRRLDGSMTLAARDNAVMEFNTDPEVTVMLMSLKAGNLGLNMVAACHVILLDLWWNPATEDQAVDRAHRIGQTRPVTVTRLTIKDTVEDRILALQLQVSKMELGFQYERKQMMTELKDGKRLLPKPKSSIELPFDVIVSILTSLPARHLRRMRSVCRSWSSLIPDSHFIREYSNFRASVTNSPHIISLFCLFRGQKSCKLNFFP